MKRNSLSPRAGVVLFVTLVFVGLGYIVVFAWYKRHSVDFIERDRNETASVATAEIHTPDIDWTFEQGSPALPMLGTGWRPGPETVWSERYGGVLYLPSSVAAGRELRVQFDGHLNPTESEVTVTLVANDEAIGRWHLTHENFEILDDVTLPSKHSGTAPWRLQFVIDRHDKRLWRGYEPGLLIYGIYLRSVRTVAVGSSDQQTIQ